MCLTLSSTPNPSTYFESKSLSCTDPPLASLWPLLTRWSHADLVVICFNLTMVLYMTSYILAYMSMTSGRHVMFVWNKFLEFGRILNLPKEFPSPLKRSGLTRETLNFPQTLSSPTSCGLPPKSIREGQERRWRGECQERSEGQSVDTRPTGQRQQVTGAHYFLVYPFFVCIGHVLIRFYVFLAVLRCRTAFTSCISSR